MELETRIREFVAKNLIYDPRGFRYSDDTSFLKEGLVDSLGVMELVAFVEKEFGVAVPMEEVTAENFDSVASLAAYVRRKRQLGALGGDAVHGTPRV
jgi:acyl carrier protein